MVLEERQKITEEMFLSIFWVFCSPPTPHLRGCLYCLGTGLCKEWYKFSQFSSVWPYHEQTHDTSVFPTIVWSPCGSMSARLFHVCMPGMQRQLQDSRNKRSWKSEKPTKVFLLLTSARIFKNKMSHTGDSQDRNFKHNLPNPKPETLN